MRKQKIFVMAGALLIGLMQTLPVAAAEDALIDQETVKMEQPAEEVSLFGAYYEAEEAKSNATKSGNLARKGLTKVQAANLYQNALNSSVPLSFETEPQITAPYAPGMIAQSNRTAALNRVNMYRTLAGLPEITEDMDWTLRCQYAATTEAANNTGLSHYPDRPAGMDDSFYEIARDTASSSNLSAGYSRIEFGIDGQIHDDSGSNLTCVGHRRWLLYPKLTVMGFGGAESGSYYNTYYAYKVFDHNDYSYRPADFDYDFVSWPGSGNIPMELMETRMPWSVSLNPYKYDYGDVNEIVVTVKNPAGVTETFDAGSYSTDAAPSGDNKYFTVNNEGYGDRTCIIFNFSHEVYESFRQPGKYEVQITGLHSLATGEEVKISYSVDLFDSSLYAGKTELNDAQYNSIEAFVERLYTKCLGRASDENGKADWSMQLADRNRTGAEVAYGFVFSLEYLNKLTDDETFLSMLYNVFLDRNADEGGLAYWKDMLNNGISREYVFRGFAESAEFSGICADYGIERGSVTLTEGRDLNAGATMFVYRIYGKALGRTPDLHGLNDWSGQIARGETSAEAVAQKFFISDEFTGKNYSDADYVKVLYRTFLDREFDEAGLKDWTERLANGASRDDVLKGFSGSKEFGEIMASYGL